MEIVSDRTRFLKKGGEKLSKIGEGRGKNQRWGRSVERGLSPGSGKLVLTRLCRLLNAVHALVSSANVVTAIYQVTGQDLHGFKSPFEHVSGCALFTDTDRPITPTYLLTFTSESIFHLDFSNGSSLLYFCFSSAETSAIDERER